MNEKNMGKKFRSGLLALAMALLFCAALSAPVAAADVCEIIASDGSTVLAQYPTLDAAMGAVEKSQTIRLLADVSYGDPVFADALSYDIDVNGHTLTVQPSNQTCVYAANGYDINFIDSNAGKTGSLVFQTSGNGIAGLYAAGVSSTISLYVPSVVDITGINQAYGLLAENGGSVAMLASATVTVTGTAALTSGICATAGGKIDISADSTVTATKYGIQCKQTGSTVDFQGDVSSNSTGAYAADGGEINVDGDVSAGGTEGFGVHVYNGGEINVSGDVSGGRYGALAMYSGSTIQVDGNAVAVANQSFFSAAAVAEGIGSTVAVGGNATVTGSNGYGAQGNNGGTVSIAGNVKAKASNCWGVCVNGYDYAGEVTVEGTIDAASYIKIESMTLARANFTTPTTKPGYLTYTGGLKADNVWVKNLITAFAWVVDGSFPMGPVSLQVPNGFMKSVAAVTDGFALTGADFVNGDLYGIGYPAAGGAGLYQVDPETGTRQLIGATNSTLRGFTYDNLNDAAYAVGNSMNYQLYSIDLNDGSATLIGPNTMLGRLYVLADVAADGKGHLYALDTNFDVLLSLDPRTGAATEIGSLGLNISGPQGLAYDRDNDILYATLHDFGGDHPGIYTIDTATGAATSVRYAPQQMDAFAIPYINTAAVRIDITTQPADTAVTEDSVTGSLTCAAAVSDNSAPDYAWYSCDDLNKTNAAAISGATGAGFSLPTSLTAGTYYYFCRVSADGAADADSNVAKVTVSAPTFTIAASAGNHGAISPSGSVSVTKHGNSVFTMTPDDGYVVADVLVDNVSAGAITGYTFSNVTANHTIAVSFVHNCPAKQFKDVDITKWYHEGIDFVLLEGLFKGVSDTAFGPDATMTRAMLVTVLYRLEGEPATAATNPFKDVAPGQWYTKAVIWAADKNIVKGYNAATFGTDDPVTREQTAAFLYRYAQYKGYDLSAGDSYNLLNFSDGAKVSSYAVTAMKWACGEGIIQGDNNKLRPADNSTRAQVATVLMRFVKGNAE